MNKNLSSRELAKKLLPRLRLIGFTLLFFSLCSLSYALISSPYLSTSDFDDPLVKASEEQTAGLPELSDSPPFMVTQEERLNLYFVAAVFCMVGSASIYLAWKKKKQLLGSAKNPIEGA